MKLYIIALLASMCLLLCFYKTNAKVRPYSCSVISLSDKSYDSLVNVNDLGIIGDGSTDYTQKLQNVLDVYSKV